MVVVSLSFKVAVYSQNSVIEKWKALKRRAFWDLNSQKNLPEFTKNHQIFIHGSSRRSKYWKAVLNKRVWYLACSQIWLNLLVDHCYFGYITKLTLPTPKEKKKKTKEDIKVIHKVMACWAWVEPLIWCFITSWLLSTKSWNFIKLGYELLRL